MTEQWAKEMGAKKCCFNFSRSRSKYNETSCKKYRITKRIKTKG